MGNAIASGFITGGILARNSGPQAALTGGLGFAVFSGAIDWFMRREPAEYVFPHFHLATLMPCVVRTDLHTNLFYPHLNLYQYHLLNHGINSIEQLFGHLLLDHCLEEFTTRSHRTDSRARHVHREWR